MCMSTDPDQNLEDGIERLIAREHELRDHHANRPLTAGEQSELHQLEVQLDELWDLLRQRRARRDAGLDPDEASIRDERTVENYEQ